MANGWMQRYFEQRVAEGSDESNAIKIMFVNGGLHGHTFMGESFGSPPERIYAADIVPYEAGTYELKSCDSATGYLIYQCRVDDDYVRIKAGMLRAKLAAARWGKLKG